MRSFMTSFSFALAVSFTATPVMATPTMHQGPSIGADYATRAKAIRKVRRQRFKPAERIRLANELKDTPSNTAEFRAAVSQIPLQSRLAIYTHKVEALRAEKLAAAQNDTDRENAQLIKTSTFTRRLRGMLKQHGKRRVAKPKKTFFEVTPDTWSLFQDVFGKNVVWFAVNAKPGHLHTLIADQGDGGRFHHNTYGTSVNEAKITGNLTQFAFPVALTDHEMARFVDYLNAGVQANADQGVKKTDVYGFYVKGNRIRDMACTNWATSAPIGKPPRWVRSLDSKLIKGAAAGEINVPAAVASKGLHKAMVEAGTTEARRALVEQILSNRNLTKFVRSNVKKVAKAFRRELDGTVPSKEQANPILDELLSKLDSFNGEGLDNMVSTSVRNAHSIGEQLKTHLNAANAKRDDVERFVGLLPTRLKDTQKRLESVEGNEGATAMLKEVKKYRRIISKWDTSFARRPHDLVLRESLAGILGLGRSQDPAKWSYDLMMSKRVPIVAVLNRTNATETSYNADGTVLFSPEMKFNMEIMGVVDSTGHVIPGSYSGSGGPPNAGSLGVVPEDRRAPASVNAEQAAPAEQGN